MHRPRPPALTLNSRARTAQTPSSEEEPDDAVLAELTGSSGPKHLAGAETQPPQLLGDAVLVDARVRHELRDVLEEALLTESACGTITAADLMRDRLIHDDVRCAAGGARRQHRPAGSV